MPTAVALVPARAGSERVRGKNLRPLAGHPLIAYTIAAARESGIFDAVIVSTDSAEIAKVSESYGAEVPGLRPAEMATSTSPDIEWIAHTIAELDGAGRDYDLFSILRPTSPFRGAGTIRRAHAQLLAVPHADSIRAVRRCREHPGKMWVLAGALMRPLLDQSGEDVPMHSRQYQSLPEVYVQDSSLEIAWTRVVREARDIAGERVVPFFSEGAEGFSIDYPDDLDRAERMIATGEAELPRVEALSSVD